MNMQRILITSKIVNIQKNFAWCAYVSRCSYKLQKCNLACVCPTLLRQMSTFEAKPLQKQESLIEKVLSKVPFINIEKHRLIVSSHYLYEAIADRINYADFFEEFVLPDTFYSWFVITELHVWMLAVRAMAEGDDGRIVRNSMVEALWSDVGQRVKKLGAGNPSEMRSQISELSEQLQATIIAYDEGLQSSDVVLAAALWRRIYQQGEVFPEQLDLLVRYIRKQIRFLDSLSRDEFLDQNNIKWK